MLRAFDAARGGSLDWYDTLKLQGNFAQLIRNIEALVDARKPAKVWGGPTNREYFERLRINAHLNSRLSRTFKRSAFTTAAVMVFSVTAIAVTQLIYSQGGFIPLVLSFGVGGFAACLYLYWILIWAALYGQ